MSAQRSLPGDLRPHLRDEMTTLRREATSALAAVNNRQALRAWHAAYLGRQGAVIQVLRQLGSLPARERPAAGRKAHALKRDLEAAYETQHKRSIDCAGHKTRGVETLDVTLPGRPASLGRVHPVTRTVHEMTSAFARMGFQVYEGPEVEWDRYNFTLLNMPPHHPARDMHDTFYTTIPGVLLRTHTSPNQVRLMEQMRPPIRLVVPGKVYRYENADPSHDWMFHQMEGLVVGHGITMGDLMGTIRELARQIFGPQRRIRFRCDYFPYVEPGLDTSVSCILCDGAGCRLCGGTGWLEAIPGGMVHPAVLRNCGIDPDEYSGFAFGAGPDRIAALKYGIDDIRRFYANDLRFLRQF
jgi:phenylalanyl-tRNA synthetase alpha chain